MMRNSRASAAVKGTISAASARPAAIKAVSVRAFMVNKRVWAQDSKFELQSSRPNFNEHVLAGKSRRQKAEIRISNQAQARSLCSLRSFVAPRNQRHLTSRRSLPLKNTK